MAASCKAALRFVNTLLCTLVIKGMVWMHVSFYLYIWSPDHSNFGFSLHLWLPCWWPQFNLPEHLIIPLASSYGTTAEHEAEHKATYTIQGVAQLATWTQGYQAKWNYWNPDAISSGDKDVNLCVSAAPLKPKYFSHMLHIVPVHK